MDSIKDKIDKEENEQLRSIPAQRLIEKLSLIKNRIEESKKRWFWELLQNASDYNDTVNVRLIVSDDIVSFQHDGSPFSLRDVLNLISPDSNKSDDEVHSDNIGKFGTGLMSTHILSSILDVQGLCVDDQHACYSFSISLDRFCFGNKKDLIAQITQAKEDLKDSLKASSQKAGFNTSFSYKIGATLPTLPQLKASDIDLNYLYTVLPYTLCFMSKVKSVAIEDLRTCAEIRHFQISRRESNDDGVIVFTIDMDGQVYDKNFAFFQNGEVSSVFQFEGNDVLEYPDELSRIFCGLPLIGTEKIGLPFVLNSQSFEPTTEREGVELEPNSNDKNRKLFDASVTLYKMMLDYVEKKKMRNAYHVAKLTRKYNGTQASNQQFYNLYQKGYVQILQTSVIVENAEGDFISVAGMRLPFKESKPDSELYAIARLLDNKSFPQANDYHGWFDAIDFTIFDEQKYTGENFAREIESKGNIYSFGINPTDAVSWLLQCAKYFKEFYSQFFSRYKLLPNQSGNLCTVNLNSDNGLPQDLKEIYDSLYEAKSEKIGDKLLDTHFNHLDLVRHEYTLEMLASDIDKELAAQYSSHNGDTSSISTALNSLYSWVSNSNESKETLASYFHWYYPKRAVLIVDMLSETQREQALTIAKSGKMESLAALASSELSKDELQMLVANIGKLPAALSLLAEEIDDTAFADSKEGDIGEEIVFRDLLSRYPRSNGFVVNWASKNNNEPRYDFEIMKNGKTICYCDAKTTRRGVANADSIPFFMRKSQWDFLQSLDKDTPYLIARVFMKDGGKIKYMHIEAVKQQ